MSGNADLLYAYGFVRAGFDATRAPAGIDDAPVTVVGEGPVAALVSRLPAEAYGAERVEERSADVSWLSARAQAHDLVLTWAHSHGGVLPLPIFSMWASNATLTDTIAARRDELARTFDRVSGADEFGVRIHRRDAALIESVGRIDPDIKALERDAADASPGQRYLMERKLVDQRKTAARSASQRIARDAFNDLASVSRAAITRALTPGAVPTNDTTLILNGAFLVDRARTDDFRAHVAGLMKEHEPMGIVFDFTGPWPPYNFVAADSDRGSA